MSKEDLREGGQLGPQVEDAIRLKNLQLQLLRRLGVAQMIEQEVGIEIPPLVLEDDPNQPPKVDLWRTALMGSPKEGFYSRKWHLNLLSLMLFDAGGKDIPKTTIRIRPYRLIDQRLKEGSTDTYFLDTETVSIEFSQDKHLKVAGDRITFEGDLATVNEELLAQVQTGIQEAFASPRVVLGTNEFRVLRKDSPQ